MKKLSELSDEVEVSIEESNITYTVADLKREIVEFGEPHHLSSTWFIIAKKKWKPDAVVMLNQYIENESEELYEDWDERATDCLKESHINKIQEILNDAFNSDYATVYWTCEEAIEIDIFPSDD